MSRMTRWFALPLALVPVLALAVPAAAQSTRQASAHSALSPVTEASLTFEPQSDTLYRAAQNAMNDGDYRRAADTLKVLDQPPAEKK